MNKLNLILFFNYFYIIIKITTASTLIKSAAIASTDLDNNFDKSFTFNYPYVKREFTFYERFGIWIHDPYRWLEDSNSNETLEFIEKQNNLTFNYIRSNENYDTIKEKFEKLYNYTEYGLPMKYGNKYYLAKRKPQQNQAIIYTTDTLNDNNEDEYKIFLDPNQLSDDGIVSLHFLSFTNDGQYCAYGISYGGSDWVKIFIKNVHTSKILSDTLQKVKFSNIVWTNDNKGFFYAYYDRYVGAVEGTETSAPKYQKLYYHRLNTTQNDDIEIFGFPDHPNWLVGTIIMSNDGKKIHIFPSEGTSNTPWLYSNIDYDNNNNNNNNEIILSSIKFKWIVNENEIDSEYHYIGDNDKNNCTYVRTNYKAKNFHIVCVDLSSTTSRDNWKVIIPESHNSILSDAIIIDNDKIVILYMINVKNIIKLYQLNDGKYLYDIVSDQNDIGTIKLNQLNDRLDNQEFFFHQSTFLSPGIIYHYNLIDNQTKIFKNSIIENFDSSEYETKQIFYKSKDNITNVPMFIVSRKNITLNGKNPTLLYGYGGFNINIQPKYSPIIIFFIKYLNGIYVSANIRGGGEFGDDWHKNGMLLNKQNVFDDFAMAGKWLIDNNYTTREYLTINGRSNGGLLTAVSSNQYPHIFGSSIIEVGVLDMLKFPLFTIGHAWMEEYGDVLHNYTIFNYIKKYSPLHNINENLINNDQYPNILVMTADHDDRVVPLHSYKFISELQFRLGRKFNFHKPLLIRIDSNSGHGNGKPIHKWIMEYTDKICFLLQSTSYYYYNYD